PYVRSADTVILLFLTPAPSCSTPAPYTTLFRSNTTQPPNPAFTFSTEQDGDALLTLAQGAQGIITFEQVNSLTLAAGKYYYDLEVTDAQGFVTTYLKGTWEIIRDITR